MVKEMGKTTRNNSRWRRIAKRCAKAGLLAAAGLAMIVAVMAAFEIRNGGSGIEWAAKRTDRAGKAAVCGTLRGVSWVYGGEFKIAEPRRREDREQQTEPICGWQQERTKSRRFVNTP